MARSKVEGAVFGVAVGALCLAAGAAMLSFGDITQDDAFISFRYAENLAAGNGLVYNVGERVEGFTNLLWTLFVAAAIKLGIAAPAAGRGLGIASAVAAVAVTALLARRYAHAYLGIVAAAMLAVNGNFLVEGAQGLETPFFVLIVTLAAWRAAEEYVAPRRRPLSALLLIVAFLTRPDGALVAVAAFPFYLATARANRRRLAVWLGSLAIAAVVYEGWRLIYYGAWLPNTCYVRIAFALASLKFGLRYTGLFLWRFTPLLLLLPLAARRRRVFYPAAALILLFLVYVTAVGGDMKPTDRFYQPIVPLLLVAAAAAAYDLARAATWVARGVWAALAVALVATSLFQNFAGFPLAKDYRLPHDLHVAAGKWLADNAPPEATLATTAAGIIPYYSGLPTIDMCGLTDRHIARHGVCTFTLPGHGLSAAEYVLDRKPDYVLIYELVFAPEPPSYETVVSHTQWPATRDLVTSPRFREEYVMSHAEIAPGEYFVYFLRAEGSR